MKTRLVTALLLSLSAYAALLADEPKPIERWDRVVCIKSQVEGKDNTGKLCTAFLVKSDEQLFLVTAGHASEETNRTSRLSYRDANGDSQWVMLHLLFSGKSNPWNRDKTSDFAIAQIDPGDDGKVYLSQLMLLAIPLEDISAEPQPRTTRIDVAGFPVALGANTPISPLAVVGFIASQEIESSTRWGSEPIVYCSPAIAQGTSGGPAFLASESAQDCTVIGMYVGVIVDTSGAKLSKLVPARLIVDAIKQQLESGEGK